MGPQRSLALRRPNETVFRYPRSRPETDPCLPLVRISGIDDHGQCSQRHLPPISQRRPFRRSEPGGKAMTDLVTTLCVICVLLSISVFLAHALDAYRAG